MFMMVDEKVQDVGADSVTWGSAKKNVGSIELEIAAGGLAVWTYELSQFLTTMRIS